jgi:hypothetical protein
MFLSYAFRISGASAKRRIRLLNAPSNRTAQRIAILEGICCIISAYLIERQA